MSTAHYVQKASMSVSTRRANTLVNSFLLAPGNWVIFAKFEVAVLAGADTDLAPRISLFRLEFGGKTDRAFCHLNQGGLDTVVLNVAGTHPGSATIGGGGSVLMTAKLICESTNADLEIKHIAMSAISVDTLT